MPFLPPLFSPRKKSLPCTPIISTAHGKLQGKRLVDEPNFKADAYLGIPYAQPPTGDLRFRKPVALHEWTGIRQCVEHPKRAWQVPFELLHMNDKDQPMSEDCLYLNVFCPGEYPKDAKCPVMVFIHGGAYALGSAKAQGDKGICDGLVRQGAIVVVVQYRLGLLGFMSTGDEVCPGNWGLWDQIAALKWIHENIEEFGGDKNNVTLFGQSAGGASTHLLSLSPHAKGLFHKIIAMSGTAHSPWTYRPCTAEFCKNYLKTKLEVAAGSNYELIETLRLISAERLATDYNRELARNECNLGFCPVIDGDLLPHSIEELEHTAPVLPLMAGVTALESGLSFPDTEITLDTIKTMIESMLPENKRSENCGPILQIYRDIASKKQPKLELWRAMTEVAGDRSFNIPTLRTIKKNIEKGGSAFLYVFDYYNAKCMGPLAEMTPSKDACHSSDLAYIFNMGIVAHFDFCDHDKQIADMMMKAFANFAKHGNPNDEEESTWPQCDADHPGRHMVIDLKPRCEEQFMEGRCEKWLKLL